VSPRAPTLEPPPLGPGFDTEQRQRFLWLAAARVLLCTVIFGGTMAVYIAEGHSLDAPTPRLLLGVIIAIYLVSLGYSLQVRTATPQRLEALTAVSIALDLVAWTILAYATGGAGSPLSTFFGLSTLSAALVLGGNATLWTAVCGLGLYGVLALLMASGLLDPPVDQRTMVSSPIEATYQMVVTVTSVAFVTAIGGTLADRLVLTGDALVRAEVSRASLARLYEDVLRSIPVAIVTFDAHRRIDSANPVATALTGRDGIELLGAELHTVLPFLGNDLDVMTGRAGDATLESELGPIPVSYHCAPLYDQHAAARGGVIVVDDRSREERLRVAVEHAERFAVLGRLAAGLAHEIRNPLGAISGCVELVRETAALDAEERKLLATVSHDVERLNRLVNDMLQFARPRPPELIRTNLTAIASDVVTLARTSGGAESNVNLALDAEGPVYAIADGNQVRQVLWNLIRNAAQASRVGADVRVRVRSIANEAEIAVLDRGPGVAPELREQLFEAFYTTTARGTGLGLALVKRVADAHGGRVEISPRDGGGSVFSFVIACVDDTTTHVDTAVAAEV
jgi:two-component system sensor histidine kinase PilS (NtrC family)